MVGTSEFDVLANAPMVRWCLRNVFSLTLGRSMSMSDRVYKKIELTGTSTTSLEEAIENAIARAAKTVRKMRWFEVVETRGRVDDGKVAGIRKGYDGTGGILCFCWKSKKKQPDRYQGNDPVFSGRHSLILA